MTKRSTRRERRDAQRDHDAARAAATKRLDDVMAHAATTPRHRTALDDPNHPRSIAHGEDM